MTIDEAIDKAMEIANGEGGTEYGERHRRLAELLEGLRKYEETAEDHTITLDKSKAFEFHVDPIEMGGKYGERKAM